MHRLRRPEQSNTYAEAQIGSVLNGIGLDIESEVDSDFIVFCPFHNNYRSPAGEVSKTTGMFWCFACHTAKDLIELVMFQTKRTYYEALRYVESKAAVTDFETVLENDLSSVQEFQQYDEVLIRRLNKTALENQRAISYFGRRHIGLDSIKSYMLGYSQKQDMVTVPVTSPDGMYIGFVGRSVEGKAFKNSLGLPKSKTMFNLSRVKLADTVIVVESSFDAIRLGQLGYPAVASLGSTISRRQILLLKKYFNGIAVVPDNDAAGAAMADRLTNDLSDVIVLGVPDGLKDIGDMTDSALAELAGTVDDPLAAML